MFIQVSFMQGTKIRGTVCTIALVKSVCGLPQYAAGVAVFLQCGDTASHQHTANVTVSPEESSANRIFF
jgi:hypothetical protein